MQRTLIENLEIYQEERKYLEEMIAWQYMHQLPPTALPIYLKRERLRYQMLFDTNRILFVSSRSTQGVATKTCTKLWKDANDLIEEAGVQPM